MSRQSHKLAGGARRLVVLIFGLWLAGAGCALCCTSASPAAHTRGDSASVERAEARTKRGAPAPTHCPAHAGVSPDAARGPNGAASSVRTLRPANDHAGSCCVKVRQPSDPARKLRPTTARAAGHARAELAQADADAALARPAARGRSPDGRATHVRCCVFLI